MKVWMPWPNIAWTLIMRNSSGTKLHFGTSPSHGKRVCAQWGEIYSEVTFIFTIFHTLSLHFLYILLWCFIGKSDVNKSETWESPRPFKTDLKPYQAENWGTKEIFEPRGQNLKIRLQNWFDPTLQRLVDDALVSSTLSHPMNIKTGMIFLPSGRSSQKHRSARYQSVPGLKRF